MEYKIPDRIKEISKRMKVIYLEKVSERGDGWEDLNGMLTIGKEVDVENLIKSRWLEYDEDLGL